MMSKKRPQKRLLALIGAPGAPASSLAEWRASRASLDGLEASQCGRGKARPLKGFGGAGVVEIVSDYRGDTFRAVYPLRLEGALYVLHAFQKKSKSGRATPKADLDLIERRLRDAERIAKESRYESGQLQWEGSERLR
jgi:phage-related protein